MEKEKVLQTLNKEIKEIFHNKKSENHTTYKNMEGSIILKLEVMSALTIRKRNKAAGPDKIVINMVRALMITRSIRLLKWSRKYITVYQKTTIG